MLHHHSGPEEVLQHRHPHPPLREENHPLQRRLVRAAVHHRPPPRLLRPKAGRRHQPQHLLVLTAVRHHLPLRLPVPEEVLHPVRLPQHHPVLHPHPAASSPVIRHHPACRQADLKSPVN